MLPVCPHYCYPCQTSLLTIFRLFPDGHNSPARSLLIQSLTSIGRQQKRKKEQDVDKSAAAAAAVDDDASPPPAAAAPSSTLLAATHLDNVSSLSNYAQRITQLGRGAGLPDGGCFGAESSSASRSSRGRAGGSCKSGKSPNVERRDVWP
jgi:hypothetical protein